MNQPLSIVTQADRCKALPPAFLSMTGSTKAWEGEQLVLCSETASDGPTP